MSFLRWRRGLAARFGSSGFGSRFRRRVDANGNVIRVFSDDRDTDGKIVVRINDELARGVASRRQCVILACRRFRVRSEFFDVADFFRIELLFRTFGCYKIRFFFFCLNAAEFVFKAVVRDDGYLRSGEPGSFFGVFCFVHL